MTDYFQTNVHGEFNLVLPRPEAIPEPKIAASLTKFIEAHERVVRAQKARDAAESAIHVAVAADTARGTALNDAGEDDPDPIQLQAPARLEAERTKARIEPARNARRIAYGELKANIDAHGDVWREASRAKAEAALKRMTAALRTVEVARVDFENHVSVLEFLAEEHHQILAVTWSAGNVESSRAIESLSTTIGKVAKAVREL